MVARLEAEIFAQHPYRGNVSHCLLSELWILVS